MEERKDNVRIFMVEKLQEAGNKNRRVADFFKKTGATLAMAGMLGGASAPAFAQETEASTVPKPERPERKTSYATPSTRETPTMPTTETVQDILPEDEERVNSPSSANFRSIIEPMEASSDAFYKIMTRNMVDRVDQPAGKTLTSEGGAFEQLGIPKGMEDVALDAYEAYMDEHGAEVTRGSSKPNAWIHPGTPEGVRAEALAFARGVVGERQKQMDEAERKRRAFEEEVNRALNEVYGGPSTSEGSMEGGGFPPDDPRAARSDVEEHSLGRNDADTLRTTNSYGGLIPEEVINIG